MANRLNTQAVVAGLGAVDDLDPSWSVGYASSGVLAWMRVGSELSNTDELSEGTTNLYHTDARAQTATIADATTGTDKGWSSQKIAQEIADNTHSDDDVETVTGTAVTGTARNPVVNLQTAIQTAVTDVLNNFVGSDVETVLAELAAMVTGMAHTAITGVDLKATGVPNQYTVEITWTDADGNAQTTTDPTPITFVDNQLTAQVIKAGPNSTPAAPTILIENTVGGVVLSSNEYALPSAKNWGHYAVNWEGAETTTSISGGEVREYMSSDPSSPVYRFEPDPYVHSSDAFYDDFDGTNLTAFLTARQ